MAGSPDSQSATSTTPQKAGSNAAPHLRRVLGLWDLIFYGIVLIQPVGAVGIFGLANKESRGHVTATILIALVAMLFTAVSYGRMAGLYPVAGSAYTYVGRGLNAHLGFMAGWAMFLDYLVIPVVSVVYGAECARELLDDSIPGFSKNLFSAFSKITTPENAHYIFWVVFFVVLATFLNLRGIKWTAHANHALTAVMFFVVVLFTVEAARYLIAHQGVHGLFVAAPFYDSKTFLLGPVAGATSLAALTYIGFDGITTLAEDVREPRRTVPVAILLVCVVIGICAFLQVYLGQLVQPDYDSFKNLDTAFFDVCRIVGGKFLFDAMTLTMAVACLGSALTGQVGAARILFGMGRDNALPRFFAKLDARNNPVMNIWLIGIVVLVVSLVMTYGDAASLINFGAFLAFIGVNAAVIREFCFRPPAGHERNWIYDLIFPALGFAFCLWIWLSLKPTAKIVGGIWCGVGLIYTAIKTRGFTRAPKMIDLSA